MKTVLLTIFTITLSTATIGQTTSIPDANFEQALIDLGLDTGTPDGNILTASIDTVTSLNIINKNISDLTGIEDFSSLSILNCYTNQLTSLNITQNAALTYLDCLNNQLTSLDVTQNSLLTYLSCQLNLLTSLDVSQNTNLTSLTCNFNELTSLDISQNTALTNLVCYSNLLSALDPSQNTSLNYLDCSNNLITNLNLSQNVNLTKLNCQKNQLVSLDVSHNTDLTELQCGENLISSIDLSQNTQLLNLYCTHTQITDLDVSLNTELIKLACNNNPLYCLNVKNGNNSNFIFFGATSNPNLTCIEVDDVNYATLNWTIIDAGVSFNTICTNSCIAGLNENSLASLSIYPNPTQGNVTINLGEIMETRVTLTNHLGQVILSEKLGATNLVHLDLSYPKGIYLLTLETESDIVSKKLIIE
jgi:Leucine-rich repeat (LRR) protein